MFVIPLTLAISLGLVGVFVLFFLSQHERGRSSGAARDSLLPLAEEKPQIAADRKTGSRPARPPLA